MKLAIYIRTVKTARGAEQVSTNIARGLADLGHAVDFLVEEEQGWLIDKLKQHNNVSVINLRAGGIGPVRHRGFQLLALLRSLFLRSHGANRPTGRWFSQVTRLLVKDDPPIAALYGYIRSARPAAVLSFLAYPNMALLLTAMLCRESTRYVVSVRNHSSTAAAQSKSMWVRSVPNLMRRYFSLADAIIAPSVGVAEDVVAITGLPSNRVSIAHNPVFRPEIIALSEQPLEHEWFRDRSVPVIVAAGKMKPQKDYKTLLTGFSMVRSHRPVRLVILGEGPERPVLERLIDELGIGADVDMSGYVENPYPYFRNASVYVLSSAWEGLPNVLIEAMSCGAPVVATDCPSGPSEILDRGRIGKLVPVGDPAKLAQAIEKSLSAPPPREVFVERAQVYSFDAAVSAYEKILMNDRKSLSKLRGC